MEENTCCIKEAKHSKEIKKNLENRLNRIEGQIRGINKMIQDNVYCDEILHQIFSVKSALDGVSKLLLEAHIKSCVVNQINEGKLEVIDELMISIKKMLK